MDIAQKRLIERHDSGKWDIGFKSRVKRTVKLLEPHVGADSRILDLGPDNLMRRKLVEYFNCPINGTDHLDLNFQADKINPGESNLITSFEVFEHLFNLFPLLTTLRKFEIPMICTVPIRFPLSKQYWTDDYHDRHYNEFEPNQIRWILKEAGFVVKKEEMWYLDLNFKGVRPFLRTFLAPSWMALYCE